MKTIAATLCLIVGACAALGDYPITIGVQGNYGTYGFSSDSGISIKARIVPEK